MPAITKKILIIDDDPISNLISERIIKEYDEEIEVTAVTSGPKALILLQNSIDADAQGLPNIILLDINMPIMNGWEFLDEYRKLYPDPLKTIDLYMLTSSRFYQDTKLDKKYTEVKEFLTKPLSLNILNRIVSSNT